MKVVLCNCSPAESRDLARTLVEEGLAACVNVVPGVSSFYVWEGAVLEDHETTLLIKVASERIPALSARIKELHPYELPEIVVLDVDLDASDDAYVRWVRSAGR